MKHASPKVVPQKRDSPAPKTLSLGLAPWQRLMFSAITRPLASGNRSARNLSDGRPASSVLGALVKAGRGMQSTERVEIYNRMYWYRLMDSLAEDCPGLRALLGERRFWRLVPPYLEKYPSTSFTLRDLPSQLARFITEEPKLTAPHTKAAVDVARFEWAQVVAFDGAALKPISIEALQAANPDHLRVSLQPHLSLLALEHAVDDYLIAVKDDDASMRSSASNAVLARKGGAEKKRRPKLRKETVFLAVHRVEGRIYYKRLEGPAFRVLCALKSGETLAEACAEAGRGGKDSGRITLEMVQSWFSLWRSLGWICPLRQAVSSHN